MNSVSLAVHRVEVPCAGGELLRSPQLLMLDISEHTVKFHVTSRFSKLGTSSRTEAVTEGIRRGLVLL